MNEVGPLINIWSMRFESKHRESKINANAITSRKNICLTLSNKHQLKLAYKFLSKNCFSSIIDIGQTMKLSKYTIDKVKSQIDSSSRVIFNNLDIHNCSFTSWFKTKGTRYACNMSIVLDFENIPMAEFFLLQSVGDFIDSAMKLVDSRMMGYEIELGVWDDVSFGGHFLIMVFISSGDVGLAGMDIGRRATRCCAKIFALSMSVVTHELSSFLKGEVVWSRRSRDLVAFQRDRFFLGFADSSAAFWIDVVRRLSASLMSSNVLKPFAVDVGREGNSSSDRIRTELAPCKLRQVGLQ
ncbi:hypothetical protein QTP88_015649 [Uroleucon formosanum]